MIFHSHILLRLGWPRSRLTDETHALSCALAQKGRVEAYAAP